MSKNGAPTSLKDELKAWSKRGGKPSTYTRAAHSSVASESSGGSASSYLSSRKVRRKRPPFSSVSFSRNAADGEGPLSSSSSANPQGGSVQEDAGTISEVNHVNAQVVVLPNISEDATREASDSSGQDSRDNGETAGDHSESQEKSYIDASASGRAEKGAENLDPTVYVPDKGEDLSDVSEISANPASSRESNVGLDATNEQEDLVADIMDDSVSSEKAQCSRQERSLPDPMDDHAYVRGSRKSSSTKRDVCGTVYTGMPERWEYDAPRHSLPGIDLAMREDLAHRPLPSNSANRSVSAPSSRVYSQELAQSYSPRREAPRSLSLYARAKPTKEPMKSRVQSARPPSTRQTNKSFFRGSLNRSRSADIDRRGRSSSRGSERSNSRLKSLLSRRRNAGDSSSSQCSSGSQDSTSARMRLVKKLFSKPNKIKRSESSEALLRISSNNWRRNSGDLTFDSSRVSSSTWDEGSMNVFTGGRDGISRRMPNAEDHARLYRDLADDRATAEEIRFASKARESTLTKVVDLPWVDFKTKLHGRFSGPVDAQLRPHGDGSLILQGNPFLVFYGTWKDGNLVSPLFNEDEKKEREVAAARGSAKRPISVMPHSRTDLPNSLGGRARRARSNASLSDRSSSEIPASNSSFCSLSDTRRQPSGSSGSRATAGRRKKRNPRLYKLGEVCRSPSDMIIYRSNRDAINSASLLDKMDQAFLKRSTGLWTCAVLAERSLQPQLKGIKNHWFTPEEIEDLPNNVEMEESLLFVIDEDGATKIVKRKHWGRFVRRMANKDASKLTKHGRAFRELEDSSCCQSDC